MQLKSWTCFLLFYYIWLNSSQLTCSINLFRRIRQELSDSSNIHYIYSSRSSDIFVAPVRLLSVLVIIWTMWITPITINIAVNTPAAVGLSEQFLIQYLHLSRHDQQLRTPAWFFYSIVCHVPQFLDNSLSFFWPILKHFRDKRPSGNRSIGSATTKKKKWYQNKCTYIIPFKKKGTDSLLHEPDNFGDWGAEVSLTCDFTFNDFQFVKIPPLFAAALLDNKEAIQCLANANLSLRCKTNRVHLWYRRHGNSTSIVNWSKVWNSSVLF